MLETLLFLIGKGIITGAASKGGQALIDKLKEHFGETLAEKIGTAYLKASEQYSLLENKVIIDYSLEDDPYYKNLIYGFNIIDGSNLSDYHKRMNKLFLLEIFKIPELANQVFNIKLDDIHKEVLDIKKDTRNIVQKFNLLEQEEAPEKLLLNIEAASVDLSSYENKFQGKIHIDRPETTEIYNWILNDLEDKESSIALLVGNAGYGKSVVLKDLFVLLKTKNIPTLGIKVDKILNISSIKDIEKELNITNGIIPTFRKISIDNELIVLLIDQIDALSQSLSSSRHAINSYDRLIKQLEVYPNVRIIISCRNYDLDYDPILRSYKGKKIFRLSLLEMQQVDSVLSTIGINIDERQTRLKEFLRIPLHLNLFCKVGLKKEFDENITLSKLYDAIWEEYITNGNSLGLIKLLTNIANKMHDQQHIVVDKRLFDLEKSELNYLMHHELLKESTDNKIQFTHQTFFDYVYARTFISSGKDIAGWLKNIHQGLFIRSQVKQIFAYLRDIDVSTYIQSLTKILTKDEYRFHLKLLLINDLGFYQNPLEQEKKLLSDHIIKQPFYFQLFLESVQSPKWFDFIISQKEFTKLLLSENEDIDRLISNLCIRIIWQNPQLVIDFLSKHSQKSKLIERVLPEIPESDIALSLELYRATSTKWNPNIRNEYYYLEKALKADPDFVIEELKKDFHENISKLDWFDNNYIPGSHSGLKIYSELYKQYPHKAIPHFIYIITEIEKSKSYELVDLFYSSRAFSGYRPNPKNNFDFHDYRDLYDTIFYSIKEKKLDLNSITSLKNTLNSQYADVLTLGIYYLVQNKAQEKETIFKLLSNSDFLIKSDSSELLGYYSNILVAQSYPLFNREQQIIFNQLILSTLKQYHHWTYETFYTKKKVASTYLKRTYSLICLLPKNSINEYPEMKKIYQEGFRKYEKIENEPPSVVTTYSGWRSYPQKAYDNMTLDDWRNSFIKLSTEQRSFDDWYKPSKGGNTRSFEQHVSQDPNKFYEFIENLIDDEAIEIEYILSGLEGLKKAEYSKESFQHLCLEIIKLRKAELDERYLSTFLRVLDYIVNGNKTLDREIFDFIIEIICQTQDREFTKDVIQRDNVAMEVVTAGINSIRGMSVELLVGCYSLAEYEEKIFETLEYIADTANEITRSCAIFRGAWLINLDKKRAFNLYLRLVKDYNLYLLAIPFHDGHPLVYLMNIDFKRLIPFFEKAITIEEAGEAMSFFLFNAYINNRPKAFTLLKVLLNNNPHSRQKLAWEICAHILKGKHSLKGWKIINILLNIDDKELGERFNNCFLHIPVSMDSQTISFINKYLKSPMGNYKSNYYYDFLRKLIPLDAKQCLTWFFSSQPENITGHFYDKSPLNVLIEAYNGMREYSQDYDILEKSMDTFDSLLQIPEYRNVHLRTFFRELDK